MKEQQTLWDYGAYAPGPPLSGHVLVGVDGSRQAMRALDHAAAEADARRTPLEILHGWPWVKHGAPEPQPGTQDVRSLLDRAHSMLELAVGRARERAPGLEVISTLSPEPAASELVRRGEWAALTVVGNRGLGRLTGLLADSVGLRVAAHCRSPLLVERGERAAGEQGHGTVVVGVADDTDAGAALFAFEEARQRGARLRVLHVCTDPALRNVRPLPAAQSEAELHTMISSESAVPRMAVAALREKFPSVGLQIDTVWYGAAQALVDATRAADTIVITTHHRHGRRPGRHLGPVAHALLHHAHCPVVLVPAA